MRYYREHRKEYLEFLDAQAILNGIVDEYLAAFQKTQPHSPCYSDVKTNTKKNRTEEFVIEAERKDLKRRAEEAEMALRLKRELLEIKESEVRKSFDVYDILYAAKWIDCKKTEQIIREMDFKGIDYSRSQIYEILKRINIELS